jgi:hypothetical protein
MPAYFARFNYGITLAASLLTAGPIAFASENGVKIGILDCYVEQGEGFVFKSTRDVSCVFESAFSDEPEHYFGVISKYGVELGSQPETVMKWAIFAPTTEIYQPGALSGDYYGATASASLAVGLGANVLVGGLDKSFALQPISLQTQRGVNFALAVAQLELRSIEQAESER